ncbi:MAG: hypothetical protein ACP5LN_10650 [Thermoproteota archaeon]
MDKEEYADKLAREWRAFLDKHKEEERFADKLAEYFNKKYEKYFKKEEEEDGAILRKYGIPIPKYGVSADRIDDKAEWRIDSGSKYGLPWITIFNGMLTVGLPDFWSTEHAFDPFFSVDNYNAFLKILEEIEHKENWEKYRNDKILGGEILLYEQADEIANEVNKKYGTNIVFHGGHDCWFDATFSIKNKSEEEIIKEIEKNISVLNEAIKRVEEVTIDEFCYEFLGIPSKIEKKISEELKRSYGGYVFFREIPVLLRYKLKYLPIIFATSMLGPQKIGEDVPFPFTFGKLRWTWTSENQEIFEELKSKAEVKIEKRIRKPFNPEFEYFLKEEKTHVFWSSKIIELKEVKGEIERVRREKLFSSKNKDDVELIKNIELVKFCRRAFRSKVTDEKQRTKLLVGGTNRVVRVKINEFYEKINYIKKQIGDNFYFGFVLTGELPS